MGSLLPRWLQRQGAFVILLACGLSGLTAGASALAADKAGNYSLKGAGFESCANFAAAIEKKDASVLAFRSWLNGYISAYNESNAGIYDISPLHNIDQLTEIMARLCKDNPQLPYGVVASTLARLLAPVHLSRKPAMIEASGDGHSVTLARELLSRSQAKLKELGLYQGGVDGLYGPGTKAAISAFQQREGLEVSGLPDLQTLSRLLLP